MRYSASLPIYWPFVAWYACLCAFESLLTTRLCFSECLLFIGNPGIRSAR